jgi:flavin-dependent dehydrogenase
MTYDAIVVGARVAGATTALLLAQKGYSVLLLEQDRFPSGTLSTHLFFTDTMQVFDRIGVLDRVLAVDAPRLKRLKFPYVDAPFPEVDGRDFALCIRREVLDTILVEAAEANPRIDVRTGTRVTGVLKEGERVTGVGFRPIGTSDQREASARIVIGADGRNSLLAREVRAKRYFEVPALFAWYYAYFPNVLLDVPPSAMAERLAGYPAVGADYGASFVFPTDSHLTLVGFGVQRDAFDAFRRDYRRHFMEGISLVPGVAARVGNRQPEGAIVGTGDLPNFFRVPAGAGWALVGDAGSHKDPHTVQGMGDAARSAVLLTDALDRYWRGECPEQDSLARYHVERDADLLPMYDFTTSRLEAQFTQEEWQEYGRLTWENQELARSRVAAMAHAIPPASVYSVEAVRAALRGDVPKVG